MEHLGFWLQWCPLDYGNGHKISVGLSPLPSFKDGHDELISANSRTSVGQEALFSAGVADLVSVVSRS